MVILSAKDLLDKLLYLQETDLAFNIRQIKVDINNSHCNLDVIGVDIQFNDTIIIQTTD